MKSFKDIRNDINESKIDVVESTEAGIRNKAEETGISYEILKQVFDRGLAAWKSSHRPGTTAVQWAYARINSFATGGKTQSTADADLWKKHKGIKEAMSRAARIKRGKIMKRMAPKLQKAKERASKKKASSEVIDKRAVKQAKDVLIKKWLKGKDKGDVAFAERERIEAKLKKSGNAINRIKKKFVKVIRKQEAEKLTNKKEESVELEKP